MDSVQVDAQVSGELADRRQLVARLELAPANRLLHRHRELEVDGPWVALVDGEEHGSTDAARRRVRLL